MTSQKGNKIYDVIIVGAGPSGSTLGYLLSDKGLDVLVIDKKAFPRPKLCGGILTWKTRRLLERLFKVSFEMQFPVENISENFFIYEKYKEKVFQKSPEPFYFIDRKKYDMELILLAKKKNCAFLFGQQITDIDIQRNTVFTKSGDSFRSKIIIGADGTNSLIRKRIFPQKIFKHNLALAFQVNIPFNRTKVKYHIREPKIFVGGIKFGYGWIFPHKDHFVVGMCGLIRKNKKIKEKCLDFINTVTKIEITKEKIVESHLVPFGNFMETPGENNILLVGDAAGFTDALTGEGIYYAHKSAEFAAQAIINFFNSGETVNLLHCYKYYLSPVYRELKISKRLRDLAYTHLRYFAYLFVKSPKFYFKLAEIIHGIKSYPKIGVRPR